jgi:mannose-6-phosphate isomerase-like protein (cupin superfamily)
MSATATQDAVVPTLGALPAGITPAGEGTDGTVWRILGHTYYAKAACESTFAFETYDPPGTYVPPHIHPTQDEFIYVIEGVFDLYLDGQWTKARPGDLVRMPKGLVHAYYNRSEAPTRALFWVSPGGRLQELFGQLHDLTDPEEVVRLSARCDVDFLPPGAVPGA